MKRAALLSLAVFMLAVSVPVFAAEMTSEQKDQCLLASKNCRDQVDSIQQKMKKLEAEINKGDKVYTAAEIKKLKDKLKDVEETLDVLNNR